MTKKEAISIAVDALVDMSTDAFDLSAKELRDLGSQSLIDNLKALRILDKESFAVNFPNLVGKKL